MAQYQSQMRETLRGNDALDGAIKREIKVTLWRFDTPTSKPVKAGTRLVKAWRLETAERLGVEAAKDLMRIDQAKREQEYRAQIRRIKQAAGMDRHHVSLE